MQQINCRKKRYQGKHNRIQKSEGEIKADIQKMKKAN